MLANLLGTTIECGCGQEHRVPTRSVVVDRDAVGRTGELATSQGFAGELALVADPDTWAAAGEAAAASLDAAGLSVRRVVLGPQPVAGPAAVREVRARMGTPAALLAVGSGTINDITKSAADEAGLPYMVVGTALSMNGYTSAISALLEGGVKRTLPATPPVAVLIDLDVCARAPLEMTRAGLGDMLSKPFCEADWRLSALVDGGYYCARPGGVLGGAFDRMLAAASGIGRAEPDALASLAEAILLSGISMAMAGVSSPASGGEHLVSHYWDMICYARDAHPFALHGTQVGVASCLVEPLYHHVTTFLANGGLCVDAQVGRWPGNEDALRAQVMARHPMLPEPVRGQVYAEARRKWRPPDDQRERLERIASDMDALLDAVGSALLPEGAVRRALSDAGAPTRPEQIHPSLRGSYVDYAHVRDMRSRYTVWDLAVEVGALIPPDAPAAGIS